MQPRLGERLKAVRTAKGYTITQVAALSGLSKSFISMLENGHTNVSATKLETLASLFGLGASDFLKGEDANSLIHVVRNEQGSALKGFEGSVKATLLTKDLHRRIQPVLLKLAGGASHENVLGHTGEEFIYVLDGELELAVDNQTVKLTKGDSAYYPSSLRHSYKNNSNQQAVLITISTPPKPI